MKVIDLSSGLMYFMAGVFGSAAVDLILSVPLNPSSPPNSTLLLSGGIWAAGAFVWGICGLQVEAIKRRINLQLQPELTHQERQEIYQTEVSKYTTRILSLLALAMLSFLMGAFVLLWL